MQTRRAADSPLGAYLRARRELADPADLGVPLIGRRRTPGLRREEVAALAGMSSAYYTRLEQGKDVHPSGQVLASLARVLGLDEEAHRYLWSLADEGSRPAPRPRPSREVVAPRLGQLLARWSGEAAIVVGRHRDVLAANALAVELNPGYRPGRNLVRDVFLDPEVRATYLDLEAIAEGAVAGLRASVGSDVDDSGLIELVRELSLGSTEFRRLWDRFEVHEKVGGTKRFLHSSVGPITLNVESFAVVGAEQTAYVFHPDPGTADAEGFDLLARSALARIDAEAKV